MRPHDAGADGGDLSTRGARPPPRAGGPGCSSELAVFEENGPYHVEKNLSLSTSAYGWDTVANLIYVDQPINTGFSYSNDPEDTVHYSEVGVANDMLDFLQEFMAKYPSYKGRPFFVTGESYAGHYGTPPPLPASARRPARGG